MDAAFKTLQRVYKQRIQNELVSLKRMPSFSMMRQALNLNRYEFVMAQPHHADEILDLVSDCYPKRNHLSKLFNLQPEEIRAMMRIRTDFVCRNGRMICAVDQRSNQVKGGVLFGDYCDHSHIRTCPGFSVSKQVDRCEQLVTTLHSQVDYKQFGLPASFAKVVGGSIDCEHELHALYGQYSYGGMTFITNEKQANLYVFLMMLYTALSSQSGYRYCVGETWHPSALRMAKAVLATEVSNITFAEMPDYVFHDGVTMRDVLDEYTERHRKPVMEKLSLVVHSLGDPQEYFDLVMSTFVSQNARMPLPPKEERQSALSH